MNSEVEHRSALSLRKSSLVYTFIKTSKWRSLGLPDRLMRTSQIKDEYIPETRVIAASVMFFLLSQSLNLVTVLKAALSHREFIILCSNVIPQQPFVQLCLDKRLDNIASQIDSTRILEIARVQANNSNIYGLLNAIWYASKVKHLVLLSGSTNTLCSCLINTILTRQGKRSSPIRTHLISTQISYHLYALIIKIIPIKSAFVWEPCSRTLPLTVALKTQFIRTVGAMHGAEMKSYMPQLYQYYYSGEPLIDCFFTWNKYWKKQLQKYNIYSNLKVCGAFANSHLSTESLTLKPLNTSPDHPWDNSPTLLIVAENLLRSDQINVFNSELAKSYKVLVKSRYSFKGYSNTTTCRYMHVLPNADEINIFPEGLFGFCFATHSTGILDAAVRGLYPILLWTGQWGDYFQVSAHEPNLIYRSVDHFLKVFEDYKNEREFIALLQSQRRSFLSRLLPTKPGISPIIDELIR